MNVNESTLVLSWGQIFKYFLRFTFQDYWDGFASERSPENMNRLINSVFISKKFAFQGSNVICTTQLEKRWSRYISITAQFTVFLKIRITLRTNDNLTVISLYLHKKKKGNVWWINLQHCHFIINAMLNYNYSNCHIITILYFKPEI